jgi:4-amino-4-deoxy-L-arabinose transferase-like glycosyltransferase
MKRTMLKNWPFLALLALALVVRIGFFIVVQPWDTNVQEQKILQADALGYHTYALRILEGQSLGELGTRRTPAYPIVLAGVYKTFGVKPWIVLLLQIAASAVTLALLYRLARSWFDQKAALVAGLLYALEPHAILYAVELQSDTFFTTVFMGSLVVFLEALRSRRGWFFFWAGLLVGVATLIRPIGQFLPALFIILTFVILRQYRTTALRGGVVLLVAYLTVITPWLYRNYHEYGVVGLTSFSGNFLLEWVAPYIEVARSGKQIAEVREEFVELARQQGLDKTDNPFEKSRIRTDVAVTYIKAHPIDLTIASIRGAFYSFINLDTQAYGSFLRLESTELPVGWYAGDSLISRVRAFLHTKSFGELTIGAFIALFMMITYILFLVGAWSALRNRNYWPVLITGAMIVYFLVFIGPIGIARYKMPFVPLYLSIAGYGFSRIVSACQERQKLNPV